MRRRDSCWCCNCALQEARKREADDAAAFVPETEEDEDDDPSRMAAAAAAAAAANIHRLDADMGGGAGFGLQVMQKKAPVPATVPAAVLVHVPVHVPASVDSASGVGKQPAVAASAAAAASRGSSAPQVASPSSAGALPGPTPGVPTIQAPGGLQSRQQVRESVGFTELGACVASWGRIHGCRAGSRIDLTLPGRGQLFKYQGSGSVRWQLLVRNIVSSSLITNVTRMVASLDQSLA